MIAATQAYETTDATIDSQIVSLRGSGANVLLTAATPKFAAQTIRKINNIEMRFRNEDECRSFAVSLLRISAVSTRSSAGG